MSKIHCDIVSAEESLYSGEVDMLVAVGSQGDLGIGYGHAALLTDLVPGPIRLVSGDSEEIFYISGGFIEVQPKTITVLADTALRADDMDEAAALEAQEAAEKAIQNQSADMDYSLAAAELAAAAAQLRTIRQIRAKLGK